MLIFAQYEPEHHLKLLVRYTYKVFHPVAYLPSWSPALATGHSMLGAN